MPISGVVARLTATGLRRRNDDLTSGAFEELQGCEPDARANQINQTSDEQSNAHGRLSDVATPA
jgi:hypothetical protein